MAVVVAAAFLFLTPSCSKDTQDEPEKDYSFSASIEKVESKSVKVAFEAGANVTRAKYAVGSIFTYAQDSVKFAEGTMKGITSVSALEGNFSVDAQEGESVVVYVRSVRDDGGVGNIICLKAVTGPIAYEVSKTSLGSFVYTCPQNIGSYAGISLMAMASTTPSEWQMSAEDIVDMYAAYDMIKCKTPGESAMVELNGEPNVDQILGIVYWNQDYTYSIKIVDFTTGDVISDAEDAAINVSVSNVTANEADLVFDPSDATCGYFYKLYTKADYDEDINTGTSFGYNPPINYIRELVAAGGTMDYMKTSDHREGLDSNAQYVLVCFPYNVNGSEGYGESKIVEFTTLAQ